MPHDKGRLIPVTDADPVDHRKALTITPDGKLDRCHIGHSLKIHKRKGLFHETPDTDKAKSVRKQPKIHWTQIAPNRKSSESAYHHNGRQADEHDKNVSAKLDINRREVKVVLTDILQTEDGQRYLSSWKSDTNANSQTPHKRVSRRSDCSTEQSTVRRSNAPCKNQARFLPLKLIDPPSSKNVSVKNYMQPFKEVQSPAAKKFKTITSSLEQPEHIAPDGEEYCSPNNTDFSASIDCQNLLPEQLSPDSAVNKRCPFEKSDSPRPTRVNPLHYKHVSRGVITATHTPPKTKQPGGFQITEYQDLKSEAVLTQQNNSESEAQKCSEVMKEKEGEIELQCEKAEEPIHQNEKVSDEAGGARGSVLRLSTCVIEGQLSDVEGTLKSSQTAGSVDKQNLDSELVEVRQTSKSQTIEPIVLSSEEEEEREDSGTQHVQAVEGDKALHKQQKSVQATEKKKLPDSQTYSTDYKCQDSKFEASALSVCPVMELQFSALYMGSFSAFTNGLIKITDDRITISFKDSSGSEKKTFLPTAHVCKYSVWDGLALRDSGLAKENEAPPPSVLVLWLAEVQARRLSIELSVFQPGTCPAEGSTCVVLCVLEPLNGVQGALLASIMDIVGLRHGNTELLSPLTPSNSLNILQNSGDSHTLQLLLPRVETHTVSCESAPASATTTLAKDSDVQPDSRVYTVCQSRGQRAYGVSLVQKPGTDWTQYQHYGPARRLIQFPPPPSKGAITVTTEDLECLDSGQFLNDVIIDFYLKYLLVQKAPQASVRRSHIFSSFFYKQLTRRDNANEDSTGTPAQLRRHQRVRTWTRHVDIFEKDFLFVPVNQEAHWYLVVVCFPGLTEPQYVKREGNACVHDKTENSSNDMAQSESQHGNGDINSDEISTRSISAPGPPTCTESTCKQQIVCKRPCILIMDSLKLSVHERIFKLLREYLQAEWEVKRGGHRDFSAELMVGSHCRVPLQDNSSDCGLYLLQYAESFLQDPVVHFDLPLKMECWFLRQKVREKREEIRDLVLHLYRFQQGSLGNDSLDDGIENRNIAQ